MNAVHKHFLLFAQRARAVRAPCAAGDPTIPSDSILMGSIDKDTKEIFVYWTPNTKTYTVSIIAATPYGFRATADVYTSQNLVGLASIVPKTIFSDVLSILRSLADDSSSERIRKALIRQVRSALVKFELESDG